MQASIFDPDQYAGLVILHPDWHKHERVNEMFEKIIVAIDGSEASEHALLTACDLAKKYKSKLHLVHSPQLETTGIAVGSGAVVIPPDPEKIEEAGRRVMDNAAKIIEGQGCKSEKDTISSESPATAILNEIKAVDADLVVMGRRGLGRISSVMLGSVSQKVSHEAECSCMTVC